MAFPTTDMEGHAQLRERVEAALDRALEEPQIDFKESAPWESLKWSITKSVLGMGNLREGGLLIVGVSERNDVWQLDGIVEADLATFDADDLASHLDKYVSPAPNVEAVVHLREGRKFLVLDIHEFDDLPFVCKKNGPGSSGLEQGAVYTRPTGGVPRTERVRTAEDMRDLMRLAAEKGARSIVEQARRLDLLPGAHADAASVDRRRYDEELGDL